MQTLPPFGLSDHKVVLVGPKPSPVEKVSSRKTVSRRDIRASRKLELGRYFSSIDLSLLNRAGSCSAKLSLFVDTIHIGMDHIMPVKHHRIHVNDAPWITAEFKNLVRLRQQAFNNGDKESYSLNRNAVNRERKSLRNKYFASKVDNLKSTKPSLFLLMINDLKVDALTWKYVDDTTISQTIPRAPWVMCNTLLLPWRTGLGLSGCS